MKKAISILTIALIAIFLNVTNVQAYTLPTFPTCLNPQGEIKASNTGTHGVPGDYATYKGIDVVYKLSGDTYMQCLCPENGNGVQTNWWKVSGLSTTEIEELKQKGYVYVPNGIVWGLEEAPYIANNFTYSCLAKGGGPTPTPGPGPTSTPAPSNNSSSSSSNSVSSVLGLANTGNIKSIYFYTVSGLFLIAVGIYSLRANKS